MPIMPTRIICTVIVALYTIARYSSVGTRYEKLKSDVRTTRLGTSETSMSEKSMIRTEEENDANDTTF